MTDKGTRNGRAKFRSVVLAQRTLRPVGAIDPRRITIALDWKGLDGPGVDAACGVEEPTVDKWETGELTPTPEQLERLAELCGVTPHFFSIRHAPLPDLSVTMCGPSGCEVVQREYPADRYEAARRVVPMHRGTLAAYSGAASSILPLLGCLRD